MLGKRKCPTGGASFHCRGALYRSQKASTTFSFSQSGCRWLEARNGASTTIILKKVEATQFKISCGVLVAQSRLNEKHNNKSEFELNK